MAENAFKVRLISVADETNFVRFDVTPTFSEGGAVEYTAVAPIHMPGAIQVYKSTASRTFNIGATFVSRNYQDAQLNMIYLQNLRSWRMPYFGEASSTLSDEQKSQRQLRKLDPAGNNTQSNSLTVDQINEQNRMRLQTEGFDLLGAPPMVLYLYAYSTAANNDRQQNGRVNINRVPVVLTNLNITYPSDVDYIPAQRLNPNGETDFIDVRVEPFPVKMEVSIDLVETHSPREYSRFSLTDFYTGRLANF